MTRALDSLSQVNLCAHATLASAHTLFSNGFVGSDTIEFATRSGILRAKKISGDVKFEKGSFLIELDFPVIPTCDYNSSDKLMFSIAFNGATIVDILGTTTGKVISKAFNGASKASSTDKIIVSTSRILLNFLSISFVFHVCSHIHLIFRLCFKLGNLSKSCSQEWMIY